MNPAFGRRLFAVTALEIAAVLWLLALVAALVGFNAYVSTIRTEQAATLDRVTAAIDTPDARRDARVAGRLAAARYPRSSVIVLLVDAERRVDVYQPA